WLMYFLSIVQAQAREAVELIERDHVEGLLSEKQLALWRWAQSRDEPTFSRREAAAALGFPLRTVAGIVARLLEMKRIERLGRGRAVRWRESGEKAGLDLKRGGRAREHNLRTVLAGRGVAGPAVGRRAAGR